MTAESPFLFPRPAERMSGMRRIAPTMLVVALVAAVATTAAAGVLRGELTFAGARTRGRHFDDAIVWIAQLPDPVEKKLVQGSHRWPWKKKPRPLPVPSLVEVGHQYEPRVSVLVVGSP